MSLCTDVCLSLNVSISTHIHTQGVHAHEQIQPMFAAVDMSPFPSSASLRGADVFLGPPGPHLSDPHHVGGGSFGGGGNHHVHQPPPADVQHAHVSYSPPQLQQYAAAPTPVSHRVCVCVCVYIYIYMYMYVCMCAYKYIYTHMHRHKILTNIHTHNAHAYTHM